jgi:hypothetical protein
MVHDLVRRTARGGWWRVGAASTLGAALLGSVLVPQDRPEDAEDVAAAATTVAQRAVARETSPAVQQAAASTTAYVGGVEVVRDVGARATDVLRGTVFDDADRDSRQGRDEAGVAGVTVSNGLDVVVTDADGRYALPVRDGMTAFVTKPAGWDVPVDADGLPQFHYHHLPAGSPPLRYGGLEPTGPVPTAVNFPIARSEAEPAGDEAFRCAVLGDVQTYSGAEIGHARDGAVRDLVERDDVGAWGVLLLGDVAGDDLGLYPRIKQTMGVLDVPVRSVPGNHDIDFDATDPDHAFDTDKREMGPEYWSSDIGRVHVVGLNNVRYPCTPEEDDADGTRPHCTDPENRPTYNGVIGEEQLAWLEADLAQVPEDHLVVVATHIPLVSVADSTSTQHQTDDVLDLYALLEGRPAMALSGHTHSLEVLEPGDSFAGWRRAVGVRGLPFPHYVAGAVSGDWYSGDLDADGLPMALQRDGVVPGYLALDLEGTEHQHTFLGVGRDEAEQMSVSVSSPTWRRWFRTLDDWRHSDEAGGRTPPPVNANDLGDRRLVDRDDLAGGSWVVTNLWAGATSSRVTVQLGDREPVEAERTQQARGENVRSGAAWADPWAATRQLQVARHGLESTSGDEDAQGYQLYRGTQFGPGPAQPGRNVADRTSHLWRAPLPADLPAGPLPVTVRATDRFGREHVSTVVLEVAEERPEQAFRTEVFEADAAG